jgi:GNAT superfamily N-acetyltransferase
MRRLLDQRADGCRLYEVTSLDDLDFGAFLPMVDRAWKLDYADEPRLDFDQAVFRKLARDPWWVGVLAVSGDGSPVGFELALERTLQVGGRTFRAYYASVFTVSADHRRQGLGRWILEGINRLVFEDRGADLIVSTFHQGHAGSPAVQSTFDRIPDWGVARFHDTPIFSRRLDKNPLPALEPAPSFVQLEMVGDRPESGLRARGASGDRAVPAAGAIDDLLRAEFQASFALAGSLSAQYLHAGNPDSGLLLYDLGSGRLALCGFNVLPMAIGERRLRPIGQLQLLLAPGATSAQIEAIVHHLALFLAERGCFAMTLLDLGVVPRGVLDRLGFAATETLITFAARGPKSTIEAFAGLRPPFFLDFT